MQVYAYSNDNKCTITFTINNTEDGRFQHIDKQNLETAKMETFFSLWYKF